MTFAALFIECGSSLPMNHGVYYIFLICDYRFFRIRIPVLERVSIFYFLFYFPTWKREKNMVSIAIPTPITCIWWEGGIDVPVWGVWTPVSFWKSAHCRSSRSCVIMKALNTLNSQWTRVRDALRIICVHIWVRRKRKVWRRRKKGGEEEDENKV